MKGVGCLLMECVDMFADGICENLCRWNVLGCLLM